VGVKYNSHDGLRAQFSSLDTRGRETYTPTLALRIESGLLGRIWFVFERVLSFVEIYFGDI